MTRPAVLRHIQTHARAGRLPLRLRQPDSVALINYVTRLEANQRPPHLADRVGAPLDADERLLGNEGAASLDDEALERLAK